MSDIVYKIDKNTGDVVTQWNMSELKQIQRKSMGNERGYDWSNAVLNGIAYR